VEFYLIVPDDFSKLVSDMKHNILLGLLLIGSLTGCYQPAQQITSSSNPNFNLELLFENEGVKVYRFMDGGNYIYYTDSRGKTEWHVSSGKTSITKTVETQ
jgi:hypothetical protein